MNANFKTTKEKLITIIEGYRQRKYVEDLDILRRDYQDTVGVLDALQVNAKQGISANSLHIREQVFGTNYKAPPTRTPFCDMVLAALEDFMLRLLIVCALFSIAVEVGFNISNPEKLATAWIEGFAILVAVAVVSLVGAWSDFQKEGQFFSQQELEEKSKTVIALRDG